MRFLILLLSLSFSTSVFAVGSEINKEISSPISVVKTKKEKAKKKKKGFVKKTIEKWMQKRIGKKLKKMIPSFSKNKADCDSIFVVNGDTIIAQIDKTTISETFYKKCNSADDFQYKIRNSLITEIRYNDGSIDKSQSPKVEYVDGAKAEENLNVGTKKGNNVANAALISLFVGLGAIVLIALLELQALFLVVAGFCLLLGFIFGVSSIKKAGSRHKWKSLLAIIFGGIMFMFLIILALSLLLEL